MKKMDVRALCEKLKRAGVVGAGGAGFPTYAKIGEGIDTVILNCAECEPLLKPHRQLLQKHAGVVLKGLDLLRESVGASRAIVALKPSYTAAAEAACAELDSYPCLTLSYLPEIYPAGDEIVLIQETTGRTVGPGQLPRSVGVCVFNVETAYNAARAAENIPVTHNFPLVERRGHIVAH